MFVHQKFKYKTEIITEADIPRVLDLFRAEMPYILGFDTETTGLHIIGDRPFLLVLGFNDHIFACECSLKLCEMFTLMARATPRVFAHNAQFDCHMLKNFGVDIRGIHFADSMAVARLTQYSDNIESRLSLEALGKEYVDDSAKFSGTVIRKRIAELTLGAKAAAKTKFEQLYPTVSFAKAYEAYKARIQFVEDEYTPYNEFFEQAGVDANYYSVYLAYPDLMFNYAMDDVAIMLEYLKKSLKVLEQTDPDFVTFNRECELIPHICRMEREGLRVDIQYLLKSRETMLQYKDSLYKELRDILGVSITVGQHEVIKGIMQKMFGIYLIKADDLALVQASNATQNEKAKRVIHLIQTLRTVDKWIGTYIDGKLNAVYKGRIYTGINNQGAVSGRVSSNLQQQPKDAIYDELGNELFHPRKMFIADPGKNLVFLDFSQMELRVQAYYTLLVGEGDVNLCRAYIPLNCYSDKTLEEYNPKDPQMMSRWNSGEWLRIEDNKPWEAVDLHDTTTFLAFPHLNNDKTHPEFKKLRKLGKMCNFLKNYQGGVKAIVDQMGVSENIAKVLDQAYYKAFPNIRQYQNWVSRELTLHGFVANLYGRRYYMQDSKWFYKAGNYLIQGSCADLVKLKEIQISEFIQKTTSTTRFILPIHDELMFSIPKNEMHIIPMLKERLESTEDIIKWIPMICEVEYTETNWAEKQPWKGA